MRRNPSEQRDRELARKMNPPLGSPFEAKVVGVSFVPGYPGTLYRLDDVWQERCHPVCYECGGTGVAHSEIAAGGVSCDPCQGTGRMEAEQLPAILVRNPDNEHDPNAVQVHVPALGEDGMVGHLTRPIVARMAPEMDSGIRWDAEVVNVLIDPDWLDRPGISIKCQRVKEDDATTG